MSSISPEERQRIYEEEKARIETERKKTADSVTSTNLDPKIGALLSYLGLWVTGIIFLLIEQKNNFIRFHAAQSIVIFGSLNIVGFILQQIPFIGWFFSVILGILAFVLWIVLMAKAYQGELFKIPVAGELAERLVGQVEKPRTGDNTPTRETDSVAGEKSGTKETTALREQSDRAHAGRIASSAFAIAWSLALLIFFIFFHDYIAFYHLEKVSGASVWVREPVLTSDFNVWLPIMITVLVISIAGHALLLAIDKYILRETVLLVLDIFGAMAIITLIAIFPFEFTSFASSDMAAWIELGLKVTMGIIVFGIGIAVIVRMIKILVNVIKGTATY
jgi:uncharacterized membrane protein